VLVITYYELFECVLVASVVSSIFFCFFIILVFVACMFGSSSIDSVIKLDFLIIAIF